MFAERSEPVHNGTPVHHFNSFINTIENFLHFNVMQNCNAHILSVKDVESRKGTGNSEVKSPVVMILVKFTTDNRNLQCNLFTFQLHLLLSFISLFLFFLKTLHSSQSLSAINFCLHCEINRIIHFRGKKNAIVDDVNESCAWQRLIFALHSEQFTEH